jgi:hypothetical protein
VDAAKGEIHDLDQKSGGGAEGNETKTNERREQFPIRNKAVFNDAPCYRAPLKNAAGKASLTQTVR